MPQAPGYDNGGGGYPPPGPGYPPMGGGAPYPPMGGGAPYPPVEQQPGSHMMQPLMTQQERDTQHSISVHQASYHSQSKITANSSLAASWPRVRGPRDGGGG